MQKKLLEQLEWDVLIILDAWRFDYAGQYFRRFIFDCVNSGASCTTEWLKKTWDGKYDYTYVSGNPFVNNSKNPITDYYNFIARDHFTNIIDAWSEVDNFGRTKPQVVAELATKSLYDKDKTIVHFLQPHAPYLFDNITKDWRYYTKKFMPKKLIDKVYGVLPGTTKQKMSLEMSYLKHYSLDQIKKAYCANLYSVDIVITPFVEKLLHKGFNVIITSDHAEYLGEYGKVGHGGEHTPLITTVPFVYLEGN